MHYRKSSIVSGHYRSNIWIEEHFRSGTHVDRNSVLCVNPQKTRNFETTCWWCNQKVFFYRNQENGGCALFDNIGYPWEVHPCWKKYNDLDKLKKIKESFSLKMDASFKNNLNIGDNILIVSDVLKSITSNTLNETTALLVGDGVFSALCEEVVFLNIKSIFLGEKDGSYINNLFDDDSLYKYVKILKEIKSKKTIEFLKEDEYLKLISKNQFLNKSLLLRVLKGGMDLNYYLENMSKLILSSEHHRNLWYSSKENNNFMYFLKGVSDYEYLIPYSFKSGAFLFDNDSTKLCNKIVKHMIFKKDDKIISFIVNDNMFHEVEKMVEKSFNLNNHRPLDSLMNKGGLLYLMECIIDFMGNKKDLSGVEKTHIKQVLNDKRVLEILAFQNSYFVKYVSNKMSFQEICFYYGIAFDADIPY